MKPVAAALDRGPGLDEGRGTPEKNRQCVFKLGREGRKGLVQGRAKAVRKTEFVLGI